MRDTLIVFLKRPRAGEAKTRLAPVLGAEAAAGLYRALAEELMRRTRPGRYQRIAYFSPSEAQAEMEAWLPGETWRPQRGKDLGERMAAAFEEVFASGSERAVIVGSDLPWLDRGAVETSLGALGAADVVLGPSHDGGYYLLALARPARPLFEGIAWSSGAVLSETQARASRLGLRIHLLQTRRDVDTPADLRALWPDLGPLLKDAALRARIARALESDAGDADRRPRGVVASKRKVAQEAAAMDESFVLTMIRRQDCSLCDEMRAVVQEVLPHDAPPLVERDVDADPVLLERYGDEVPVLMLGEREVVRHRVSAEELRRRLARMGFGSPT